MKQARTALLGLSMVLAGCSLIRPERAAPPAGAPLAETAAPEEEAAGARPAVRPPPRGARTADEFDTTSAAERKEAAAAPPRAGEALIGRTVASLGDPAQPGFWLETPLVQTVRQGRVVFQARGTSAQVELRPIGGPATGGSRISLAAMRVLGAALTDLPEIEVYGG